MTVGRMAKTAKEDSARIDIGDPRAIPHWCRRLRCRQSDLIAPVIVLGPAVAGVEQHLRRRAAIAACSQ